MGNRKPETGVQVTGTGAPPLLAVGLKVTVAPAALVASTTKFSRGGLNTGGLSATLTWRVGWEMMVERKGWGKGEG
jgi:hypothetical protein